MVERVGEILLDDQRSARGVDEKRARLHLRQRRGVDDSTGLRQQRTVQADDVGRGQEIVQLAPTEVGPVGRILSACVLRYQPHTKRDRDLSSLATNPAKADDSHGLALQLNQRRFTEAEIRGPRPLSGASRLAMQSDVMAQFEQQRENQLRHRGGSVSRHVGDENIVLASSFQIDLVVTGKHLTDVTQSLELLKRISRQRRPYSQHNLGLARASHDFILSSPIENFQLAKAPKSVPTKVTRIN